MAGVEFDIDAKEIIDYVRDIRRAQDKAETKEAYKFLRKEGGKLRRKTVSQARTSGIDLYGHVKSEKYKNSAHYKDTIKRGKAYVYDNVPSIRVYSSAPHAHLLEYGHKLVGHKAQKKKSLGGRTRAFKPFEKAYIAFQSQFYADSLEYYAGGFKSLWSK